MSKIKNVDVTESMMNMKPIKVRDIGFGAKILVLKRINNNHFLTCLERDGVRCNFANSKVQSYRGYKYVHKFDGVYEDGGRVQRNVEVSDLYPKYKRVRPNTERVRKV